MFFKRLMANLTIISIIFLLACPIVGTHFSYAENSPEGWEQVTNTSDLVDAFRYYCKSRDLTIEGTVADAVTSFTTDVFNGLCVATGINITELQAELKKSFDNQGAVQYLFTRTGITAYNRLFAQFLQDNELSVGDTVEDQTLYDGYYYNNSLVWVGNSSPSVYDSQFSSVVEQQGSYYKYSVNDLISIPDDSYISFPEFGLNYLKKSCENFTVSSNIKNVNTSCFYKNSNWDYYNFAFVGNYTTNKNLITLIVGYPIYFYNRSSNTSYLCVYTASYPSYNNRGRMIEVLDRVTNEVSSSNAVSIYINAPTINNNVYEGDTIINNNGTPSDPSEDPGQDPDPDNWDYPDIPSHDPYPGNPGTGIDWPSIDLPDIDLDSPSTWSLGNITQKFPFSIPFDLVALLTVINHDPVTPDFTSDIQIGSIYNWHIDADLSDYNGIASLIRTFEFIGFCVGLLYFTVRIVKG